MTFEEIEIQSRAKKGLFSYLAITYIIGTIISLFLLNIYPIIKSIDVDEFNNIIQINNFSQTITTYYEMTVHVINFLSLNNFLVYVLLTISLIIILKKDIINDLIIFNKENIKSTLIKLAITTVIFFTIYYTMSYLTALLSDLVNINQSANQEFVELALEHSTFIMVITTVLLGPICEELVFRKSFFGLLKNKKLALCLSSFTFAAIHLVSSLSLGYNVLQLLVLLLPYLTAGFLFGIIYLKTNLNIYFVTIIHILTNLIAVIIILTSLN